MNQPANCAFISNVANPINTGDVPVDSAHNYAITTYNYFSNQHNWKSYDNKDSTVESYVRYSFQPNVPLVNAFWRDSTKTMHYGAGDGIGTTDLSKALDVVAHEFTHGVTMSTSKLIYCGEPGGM